MQNEPIEVTLKVTGVFELLGIPYLIGGSFASALYGMVRTAMGIKDHEHARSIWCIHPPYGSSLMFASASAAAGERAGRNLPA